MKTSFSAISKPTVLLPAFFLLILGGGASAIVPPRSGGDLPGSVREMREKHPRAYVPGRGWIGRAASARAMAIAAPDMPARSVAALSGTMRIPVLAGLYSDYTDQPEDLSALQMELFDGPWQPGTMAEYYGEASAGLFAVAGDVYGWIPLSDTESWYTGDFAQGLVPGVSHTDVMIEEVVALSDPYIDFGAYDNDGPDGVPNSGDDDGYVDVLIVVHPAYGAECDFSPHMWSHSWQYSLWDGEPGGALETEDPAAGGGVILVDDYIIAPAVSCDGGLIEIGVFCHELGHSIGLPDLYDGYGSSGIGHWGLMGSGNWNTPQSPAHPCAWSKEYLGWVDVIEVGCEAEEISLSPVIGSAQVAKLETPTVRFRRMNPLSAPSGAALVCGYTDAEAGARGWPGGAGYGNLWNETVSRRFVFDGTYPVTLEFGLETDLEQDYDFAYVLVQIPAGSDADTLAAYTGERSFAGETIDLSPYLIDTGYEYDYTVSFVVATDWNYSDEDGWYRTSSGRALLVDNISLTGGGEAYFSDFTYDAGGWRYTSPPPEYFIVEHRTRSGFDSNLHGEGLLIWHAESSTALSYLGNSGGATNNQSRGLVLEEADGRYDLLKSISEGGNYGDQGDPWPGSTSNRNFTSTSVPSSHDNSGRSTPVSITGIRSGSALFVAGMAAPEVYSVDPDTIDKTVSRYHVLDVAGSGILPGAGCALALGDIKVSSDSVEWVGDNRIMALFDSEGLYAGSWDLIVISGDGQEAVLSGGLEVRSSIILADVEIGLSYIRPVWMVGSTGGLRGSLLYRAAGDGTFEQLGDTLLSDTGGFEYMDESVNAGVAYRYRVRVIYGTFEEEFVFPGEYSIEDRAFQLLGSYPNPFSGSTKIVFFVPDAGTVRIVFYDVSGRVVDDLGPIRYERGTNEAAWEPDPSSVASGVYFCVVESGGASYTRKVVLIR